MTIFWKAPHIESVLAYFGDGQYTVKIDRLCTGEIRYLCWHKSNSILAKPNLILSNGRLTESQEGRGTEYVFNYMESNYTVEHLSSKNRGKDLFFVEVTSKDQKKSTWKMEQMPIPKYLL